MKRCALSVLFISTVAVCGVLGGYIVFEKLLLLSVLVRSVPFHKLAVNVIVLASCNR